MFVNMFLLGSNLPPHFFFLFRLVFASVLVGQFSSYDPLAVFSERFHEESDDPILVKDSLRTRTNLFSILFFA